MVKKLKPGKVMSPKIKYTVESKTTWYRLLVIGLLLAFVSLSCSIGMLSQSDPPFIPPGKGIIWTASPNPTLLVASPTPDPPSLPPSSTPVPEDPTPTSEVTELPPLLYRAQAGDTLPVMAIRFGVQPSEITSPDPIPETALFPPNQLLIIPHRLVNTTSSQKIIPDSEVVFSPSATDFDMNAFVNQAGGYLSGYREYLGSTAWTNGADIIARVARDNSINPRLLLALLEYQSGWVYGQPGNIAQSNYPMGKIEFGKKELYQQLVWAVNQLSIGYYGWREGLMTEVQFSDGVVARLAPDLNAGTVALQYYLTQVYDAQGWVRALDLNNGLPALYERMFGNPWLRALNVEPLYPPGLTQPTLILPFLVGQLWSFTGGPHGAWEHEGARAALDFAPAGDVAGCVDSNAWAVAAASGLVVRTGKGMVVLDLDGDGREQTGWDLIYLHLTTNDRVQVGDWVETGDLLGHPSCEGGISTGTHIHLARKYNGEWIPADGPTPFVLNGWIAHAGEQPYQGSLTRDGETIQASIYGSFESRIVRDRDNP